MNPQRETISFELLSHDSNVCKFSINLITCIRLFNRRSSDPLEFLCFVNFYCTILYETIILLGIKNIYVTRQPENQLPNIKKPSECDITHMGRRRSLQKTDFEGSYSWECNTRHKPLADACICNDNKNNNLATWRMRKVSHIEAISHKLLKKRPLWHMPTHGWRRGSTLLYAKMT